MRPTLGRPLSRSRSIRHGRTDDLLGLWRAASPPVTPGVFAIGAVVAGVAIATLLSNGFDILVGNQSFSWWHLFYWTAPVTTFGAVAAVSAKRLKADNRAVLPRRSESERLPAEFIPPGA